MDTMTINITLPKPMKKAVDAQIKNGLYTSFSEFVRNAVRNLLSTHQAYYTGPFSPEAQKEILKSAKETLTNRGKNIVLKTPEDIDNFFKRI
jgi:putative addiction module CopG family antidote